jgi:hypothetical protein
MTISAATEITVLARTCIADGAIVARKGGALLAAPVHAVERCALLVEGARFAGVEAPALVGGLPAVNPSSRAAGLRAGDATERAAGDAAVTGLWVTHGPGLTPFRAPPITRDRLVRRTFTRTPVADLTNERASPTRAATAIRATVPIEAVRQAADPGRIADLPPDTPATDPTAAIWTTLLASAVPSAGGLVRPLVLPSLLEARLLGLAGFLLALGGQIVGGCVRLGPASASECAGQQADEDAAAGASGGEGDDETVKSRPDQGSILCAVWAGSRRGQCRGQVPPAHPYFWGYEHMRPDTDRVRSPPKEESF